MRDESVCSQISGYPGIDKLSTRILSRSFDRERREQLGMGFMHKPGREIDELNQRLGKYAMIYVIRGRGRYVDPDGNEHLLSPGSVFQRHPMVEHSTYIDPSSRWAECFLDFGIGLYESLVAYKLIRRDHYVYSLPPDPAVEREFYELYCKLDICSEAGLPFVVTDLIGLLSGIMRRCTLQAESSLDRIIDKSCVDFREQISRRIDLRAYCRQHGIGYECFRKAFKQKTGVPPGHYIINRRMDAACELLKATRDTVGSIAANLGYCSQYEFSAQFKKLTGMSPKIYRG
ncbi:MAG: helix-turn-helix transcriptional regulator [Victivallales bacterium]|nr:helix-turn-helix transcriptional regulator [Victivallales bacterium]